MFLEDVHNGKLPSTDSTKHSPIDTSSATETKDNSTETKKSESATSTPTDKPTSGVEPPQNEGRADVASPENVPSCSPSVQPETSVIPGLDLVDEKSPTTADNVQNDNGNDEVAMDTNEEVSNVNSETHSGDVISNGINSGDVESNGSKAVIAGDEQEPLEKYNVRDDASSRVSELVDSNETVVRNTAEANNDKDVNATESSNIALDLDSRLNQVMMSATSQRSGSTLDLDSRLAEIPQIQAMMEDVVRKDDKMFSDHEEDGGSGTAMANAGSGDESGQVSGGYFF